MMPPSSTAPIQLSGIRMSFGTTRTVSLAICILIMSCLPVAFGETTEAAQHVPTAPNRQPWNDPNLTPDEHADRLNRELTLDERITLVHGLLALPFGKDPPPPEAIPAAGYVPGVPR